LSVAITALYTHKGNRIVFANNLSLNQLAFDLWIDVSTLSRVLSGERLFTPKQLDAFCKKLKLNSKTINKLENALQEDISIRYGLKSNINYSKFPNIDFLNNAVDLAHDLRISSYPWKTLEWINQIEQVIYKNYVETPQLLEIKTKACYEKLRGICEVYEPNDAFRVLGTTSLQLINLSKKINNPNYLGMAYNGLADRYYFLGDHKTALKYFLKGHDFFNTFSKDQLFNIRNIAICYSHVKQTLNFNSIAECMVKNINKYPEILHGCVYEGLARAYANVGQISLAESYIQKAENNIKLHVLPNNQQSTLRSIQLLRAKLEVIMASGSNILKRDINTILNEAYLKSRQFNSIRYIKTIDKLTASV
jgi:tetratricopeptide (TPR) repeat protein